MSNVTVYHVGVLATDREALNENGVKRDPELDATAKHWLGEAAAGRAILVQRRLGPSRYEYLAYPQLSKIKEAA